MKKWLFISMIVAAKKNVCFRQYSLIIETILNCFKSEGRKRLIRMLNRIFFMVVMTIFVANVYALDSDQDQPATLEADDFELDLRTGVRIYRGNVLFRQGSIRLECDELVTYFNDDDELDKAVCSGDPGKFKQRPENSEEDMIGKARVITLDQVAELVIMKSRADITQGGTRLTGRLLTYNLATEKVVVKGGSDSQTKTTTNTPSESTTTEESAATNEEQAATAEESTTNARPTIIIQPRKKKKN